MVLTMILEDGSSTRLADLVVFQLNTADIFAITPVLDASYQPFVSLQNDADVPTTGWTLHQPCFYPNIEAARGKRGRSRVWGLSENPGWWQSSPGKTWAEPQRWWFFTTEVSPERIWWCSDMLRLRSWFMKRWSFTDFSREIFMLETSSVGWKRKGNNQTTERKIDWRSSDPHWVRVKSRGGSSCFLLLLGMFGSKKIHFSGHTRAKTAFVNLSIFINP